MSVTPDFSQLLARLVDSGFQFVIVGGYAAVAHGSAQVTRDVDICAALTSENVETLRRTLAPWKPRHRMTPQRLSFLDFPPAGTPLENLYLQTDLGVIDILSSVLGVGGFERLKSKAEKLEIEGRVHWLISLEDLIQAKEALGREKDLLVAKELRAIAEKQNRS
jgi:predicted nucleotidyltransferase